MKKLLLSCGIVALLSGAATVAQAETSTPGNTPVGAILNTPVFSFNNATTSNPVAVEVDLIGPLLNDGAVLFAVATEDKDVITNELVTINTYVDLNQIVDDTNANDFAEASAMAVQVNDGNRDCADCAEKTDTIGGASAAAGAGSFDTGLVSINQAAGNMNNQGTLVSAAVDVLPPPITPPPPKTPPPPGTPTPPVGTPSVGGGFAHAQAEATQVNGTLGLGEGRGPLDPNVVNAVDLVERTALIDNSFDHDNGLVYGNQATGNNNNQLNELALAFSARPQGVAIAESDLGQFNSGNSVGESGSEELDNAPPGNLGVGINKTARIDASLNNDQGVFGVNQAVGNNGNQANIVSVAAVGTGLTVGF